MHDALISALRGIGDAVESVASLGRRGLSDEDQLEFAAANGWTIFSFDVGDVSRIHWEWLAADKFHGGIVLETNSLLPIGELVRRFRGLLTTLGDATLAGRLEYLNDYR